jgi:hypothetical protein
MSEKMEDTVVDESHEMNYVVPSNDVRDDERQDNPLEIQMRQVHLRKEMYGIQITILPVLDEGV